MGIPEIATGALRSGGGATPASDENTADEDDGDSTLAGPAPLRADRPRETTCLKRQIGFSTGFYGRTDHWGDL